MEDRLWDLKILGDETPQMLLGTILLHWDVLRSPWYIDDYGILITNHSLKTSEIRIKEVYSIVIAQQIPLAITKTLIPQHHTGRLRHGSTPIWFVFNINFAWSHLPIKTSFEFDVCCINPISIFLSFIISKLKKWGRYSSKKKDAICWDIEAKMQKCVLSLW